MDERIVKFISALRSAGVRVSLAESADAFSAVDQLGVWDRDTFRLSLLSTLVKDARNIPVFEELFPLFFGNTNAPPLQNLSEDLTPEEAQMIAEGLRQFSEQIRQMLERMDALSRALGILAAGLETRDKTALSADRRDRAPRKPQ